MKDTLNYTLVTGGAGYIGSHTVVELCENGYSPIIIDNLSKSSIQLVAGAEKILGKKLIFFQVDCCDKVRLKEIFNQYLIGQVIHFAAFKSVEESVRKPISYYQNNINSLLTLLEVMKEYSTSHLVFSSSCSVYGQSDIVPVKESTPFAQAQSPYGATKQMCERILADEVIVQPQLKVISLRYFNPIGAHASALIGELPIGTPSNIVPVITQVACGKREFLTVFGTDYDTKDGSCLRDYIHITDLANAHVKALEKIDKIPNRFEPINVGTGKPISVLELINTFQKTSGLAVNHVLGARRAGDVEKVFSNVEKSRRLLDWQAKHTVEDALLSALRWEQTLNS